MKKTVKPFALWRVFLTLSVYALYSNISFAQGTLQFNQVIHQNIATSTGGACYTVPAGKVFKLEAILSDWSGAAYVLFGSSCGTNNLGSLLSPYTTSAGSLTYGVAAVWPFPIWVKAGTSIQSSSSGNMTISGIEFNVVP